MRNDLFFRVIFIALNVFFAKGWDSNYLDSQGNDGLYDVVEAANKNQHDRTDAKSNKHSKPHENVSQICPVSLIRKGQIIKTNDSIRAGAQFLDTPSVGTVKECHEICCNLLHCNIAIVKVINSNKVSCYLFDCGVVSKCSFDTHKDYKVIELKYQTKNDSAISYSNEVTVLQNMSHVEKKPGIICQPGYHVIGNDCRENCSNEFYFECANIDRPAFKQCIATYDKCDGYQQCDDNSDEINCPSNEDVKAEVNDNIFLTITRQPSKMPLLSRAPNMTDLIKINSIRGEMKTYVELPNSLTFYPTGNSSILEGNLKNDSQSLVNQSPTQFYQNNNHAVDVDDGFNGPQNLREPHPDDSPIVKSHVEAFNNGIRGNNASTHDFSYGGVTHHYGGDLSKMIEVDKSDGDHLAASFDVINPAKNYRNNQYNKGAYNRHLKVDEFSVVPYKHQGTILKGSLYQDSLLNDIKHRSQISSNSNVESTRKNLINWNPHFYDGMSRVVENVNDGGIIDGNKDQNVYGEQHMFEDSNYAKELADYGNKINKISTEHKSLSLNIDDRLRKSSLDTVDHRHDNNIRKHDLFDFDRRGHDLLGIAHYDAAHLQNHADPNSKSQNLVNYYRKFSVPNKNFKDRYHSKEVDSFSNYLAPPDNRLDYYIEYDSDPKQLYDYEYKLHNLDPLVHQKSVLRRIASNYFSPNAELNRVRSGYFNGVSSKQDSNKALSLHTNSQYGEKTSARSTSQIPLIKRTTLTKQSSSPIQNITLAVTSSSLSTPAPSLIKSFSIKFIELSKFSKHRVDDFKGGAILVLSLGISLVIVSLAVFICQLQKFRKHGRNRKAKNMDGDSDYLINGLYL